MSCIFIWWLIATLMMRHKASVHIDQNKLFTRGMHDTCVRWSKQAIYIRHRNSLRISWKFLKLMTLTIKWKNFWYILIFWDTEIRILKYFKLSIVLSTSTEVKFFVNCQPESCICLDIIVWNFCSYILTASCLTSSFQTSKTHHNVWSTSSTRQSLQEGPRCHQRSCYWGKLGLLHQRNVNAGDGQCSR